MVQTVLLVTHVSVALALVVLVLLQQGKGADAGAAFGSGASSTVFGSRGSATFLSRLTAGLAAGFFAVSLTLAVLAGRADRGTSSIAEELAPTAPLTESAPTDSPPQPAESTSTPEGVPPPAPAE
jgi:preprotein translocase subunit SecG